MGAFEQLLSGVGGGGMNETIPATTATGAETATAEEEATNLIVEFVSGLPERGLDLIHFYQIFQELLAAFLERIGFDPFGTVCGILFAVGIVWWLSRKLWAAKYIGYIAGGLIILSLAVGRL